MVVVGVLVVAVVVVVVGKVVVVTEAVRSATVVLVVVVVVVVVVVGSGRLAAMRPAYPYPLAQTKYELWCMLSDRCPQVSILKKCNQTQRNPLYIK